MHTQADLERCALPMKLGVTDRFARTYGISPAEASVILDRAGAYEYLDRRAHYLSGNSYNYIVDFLVRHLGIQI